MEATSSRSSSARTLLACGIAGGPLYVGLGVLQMAIRPGFDIRRHPLSLMVNGELGWIQVANFVLTGALLVGGAVGLGRALGSGRGATWAPRMLALYGAGLIGAGIFRADPALGFPPGTPDANTPISWHGTMHFVAGAIGFAGLIATCIILARRFRVERRMGWSAFSAVTGLLFLASFIGIASGSRGPTNVLFALAVLLAFVWLSAVLAEVRSRINR